MPTIRLKLHKIKCITKQEVYRDEIMLWGVMVCNNTNVLNFESSVIPEKKYWDGSVKNYSPPLNFMSVGLFNDQLPNGIVVARAAIWIVERDLNGGIFWEGQGSQAQYQLSKLLLPKLDELGREHSVEAFKAVLPAYHSKIVAHTSFPQVSPDSDEVFPYINAEYRSNQLPPLHSETTPVETVRKKAHGGEYEIQYSWSLEV